MNIGYRKYSSRRRFSALSLLAVTLIVVVALFMGACLEEQSQSKVKATVLKVSDGDTIRVTLDNGSEKTIRLIGLDTPETHHPTKPVGCFGPEAENYTRKNLNGKEVELEFDVERTDKYGRTLAYVYLKGKRFNDELVALGFAKVLSIEPNTRYARKYTELEIQARKSNLGMWGYCTNDN